MGTLRFVSQYPDHPWWNICVVLIQELAGGAQGTSRHHRPHPLPPGTTYAVHTPREMLGARNNICDVAAGKVDVGVTTPTSAALLAFRGKGPFREPHPQLRAIAAYPHDDFLVFLVDARHDAQSLVDLLRNDRPLRLVTGREGASGNYDVLTYCVDEVMRYHGADFDDVRSRPGSSVTFGGPTRAAAGYLLHGDADALFHEAQGHPAWARLAEARNVKLVSLDPDIVLKVSQDLSLPVRRVPVGYPVAHGPATITLDFSGWLVFVHEKMDDRSAYALAMACDESRSKVEDIIPDRSVVKPLRPASMFRNTGIPLHPGARAYAEARGYLD